MFVLRCLFVIFVMNPCLAAADWFTSLDGPDVFGEQHASLFGEMARSQDLILFKCHSNGKYSMHWLITLTNPPEQLRELTGHILMQSDTGQPTSIAVDLQPWNKDHIALSAYNDPTIFRFLGDIRAAYSKIEFGHVIPEIDVKTSDFAFARFSTASVNGFLTHCGLR